MKPTTKEIKSKRKEIYYAYSTKYGTLPLLTEIPWFGRNAKTMHLTGERLLKAFIMMNTVKSGTWGTI
ncbi:MAG: hypothetical protein L3J71_18210 [Victivallaceae bacterium]|nr:hypothetical protein [Victivallaceae bacterium]